MRIANENSQSHIAFSSKYQNRFVLLKSDDPIRAIMQRKFKIRPGGLKCMNK